LIFLRSINDGNILQTIYIHLIFKRSNMTSIQKIKLMFNVSLNEIIGNLIKLFIYLKLFIFTDNYNKNKHYQYNFEVSNHIFLSKKLHKYFINRVL